MSKFIIRAEATGKQEGRAFATWTKASDVARRTSYGGHANQVWRCDDSGAALVQMARALNGILTNTEAGEQEDAALRAYVAALCERTPKRG